MGRVVEGFESHARGHSAVADDCHRLSVNALMAGSNGHTEGSTNART